MKTVDPNFEKRVRASFARQTLMSTIGALMTRVSPGEVVIELAFREDLTQQHGFVHAGIITAIVDSACGYAALSLMPPDSGVLTVEYKANFISPAKGARFVATGRVVKPGRTLTVCSGDVVAINDGNEKAIATMLATMMRLPGGGDLQS
ncbi:MAG TPA: PaaI family thioesterase [Blastocatellia bacterium]|nr:PaaI family thioesterase [Blastocatellia bacterium]